MRVPKHFHLPSRTKQSFRDECNINNIMSKYMKNGLLTHINDHKGRYEDLPNNIDFHEAMNSVRSAETAFASLTSEIRYQFNNDPGLFLEFVMDPDNIEEINALGLGVIPEVPDASPAPEAEGPPPDPAPPPGA